MGNSGSIAVSGVSFAIQFSISEFSAMLILPPRFTCLLIRSHIKPIRLDVIKGCTRLATSRHDPGSTHAYLD